MEQFRCPIYRDLQLDGIVSLNGLFSLFIFFPEMCKSMQALFLIFEKKERNSVSR